MTKESVGTCHNDFKKIRIKDAVIPYDAAKCSEHYWQHAGATFAEHLSLYGFPLDKLATGTSESSATHLKYHFSMQLEFAYMAIQWVRYSGNDLLPYLPFINSVV